MNIVIKAPDSIQVQLHLNIIICRGFINVRRVVIIWNDGINYVCKYIHVLCRCTPHKSSNNQYSHHINPSWQPPQHQHMCCLRVAMVTVRIQVHNWEFIPSILYIIVSNRVGKYEKVPSYRRRSLIHISSCLMIVVWMSIDLLVDWSYGVLARWWCLQYWLRSLPKKQTVLSSQVSN